MKKSHAATELVGFQDDYHAWVLEQIELIKAGRLADLDVENLAGELTSLVTSEQQEIESRLTVLLQHLLKWEFQPARRSNSWRATILEKRMRINRTVQRSPSLRRYPATVMAEEYILARLRAADETDIPVSRLPKLCPYTAAQVLDDAFWPGGAAGFED